MIRLLRSEYWAVSEMYHQRGSSQRGFPAGSLLQKALDAAEHGNVFIGRDPPILQQMDHPAWYRFCSLYELAYVSSVEIWYSMFMLNVRSP